MSNISTSKLANQINPNSSDFTWEEANEAFQEICRRMIGRRMLLKHFLTGKSYKNLERLSYWFKMNRKNKCRGFINELAVEDNTV